jgi:hypothetical protein
VLDRASEKLLEHDLHHEQHQKRRKHTPRDAKNGALVLLFEIAFYQFFKQELVTLEFCHHMLVFYHITQPRSSIGRHQTGCATSNMLSQEGVNVVSSNLNNHPRKSLDGNTPYGKFIAEQVKETLSKNNW